MEEQCKIGDSNESDDKYCISGSCGQHKDNDYRCCYNSKVNWGEGLTDWCIGLRNEWEICAVSDPDKLGNNPIYDICELPEFHSDETSKNYDNIIVKIGNKGYYVQKQFSKLVIKVIQIIVLYVNLKHLV